MTSHSQPTEQAQGGAAPSVASAHVENMGVWAQFKQRVEDWASVPFFGAVSTSMSILAGCMASFFTKEILCNFGIPFTSLPDFSFKASSFWLCALAAVCLLWLGLWAQGKKSKKTADSLDTGVKNLQTLPGTTDKMHEIVRRLQTMPSDIYLRSNARHFRYASNKTFLVLLTKEKNREMIEEAIRIVLNAMAQTAKAFDKADVRTVYSANVMLWREDAEEIESENPVEAIPGAIKNASKSGLLELVQALSATSETGLEPDTQVPPLIIPIPADIAPSYDLDNKPRFDILPGAPWAFCKNEIARFSNASEISSWAKNKLSDTKAVVAMRDYFTTGRGQKIASFVSYPILLPGVEATAEILPIGVLNLNSTRENLLTDNGDTLFAPLLEPFFMLLSILLMVRKDTFSEPSAEPSEPPQVPATPTE